IQRIGWSVRRLRKSALLSGPEGPALRSNIATSRLVTFTPRRNRQIHPTHQCTLALTDASPVSVNLHVFVLFPLLEHAPDQTASRSLVTLSVIDAPTENDAEPALPTDTLMPAGLDVTRSPLRPLAVTVNVAPWACGTTA